MDPSLAHKVLLAAISEAGDDSGAVHESARRSVEAVWARECDIADPGTIIAVAHESGSEGDWLLIMVEKEQQYVEMEQALTDEAATKQHFGGPTHVCLY